MGESHKGAYSLSNWTLHITNIIIFGTWCVWGVAFKEWAGWPERLITASFHWQRGPRIGGGTGSAKRRE